MWTSLDPGRTAMPYACFASTQTWRTVTWDVDTVAHHWAPIWIPSQWPVPARFVILTFSTITHMFVVSIHRKWAVVGYKLASMSQSLMMYGSRAVPVPLRTPFAAVKSAFDAIWIGPCAT